jgi:hypothetical protein
MNTKAEYQWYIQGISVKWVCRQDYEHISNASLDILP